MHDVIIVGGGPAGLAAAVALAERGITPCVVDRSGGLSPERGELLAHGAFDIVQRLGLADLLDQALPIKEIASHWGSARMQSHAGVPGLGFYGWGLNRRALALAMLKRVTSLGVPVHESRVTAIFRRTSDWVLTFTNGTQLKARYLVDASGRPGAVARRQGVQLWQDTDLVTLIWKTRREAGPAIMRAEAAPDGWWYAVPYGADQTVGFATSAARAKEIGTDTQAFLRSKRGETRLIDPDMLCVPVRVMDSRSAVLEALSGPGWVATGDAATAFDPVSSQGLFNALSGGFFAGNAAADALAGDTDAPRVYAALAARTAERTHALTRLQYATTPYETEFWQKRAAVLPDPSQKRTNDAARAASL